MSEIIDIEAIELKRVRPFRICFTVYVCLISSATGIPPRTSQPQAIRFTSSLRIPLILLLRQHPSIINSKDFFKGMLLCGLHSQRPQVHYCYMARFLTFALIFFASFSFRFSLGIWIDEFSYACISKCLL